MSKYYYVFNVKTIRHAERTHAHLTCMISTYKVNKQKNENNFLIFDSRV